LTISFAAWEKVDDFAVSNDYAAIEANAHRSMEDPILYTGKVEHALTEFIHENGDCLFLVLVVVSFFAIAWLLFRKRKSPPPVTASARTRAIVGIMLASPGMTSDADGGRTRLIMGDTPARRTSELGSNQP
jgi:hypothetical protein